MFSFFAPSIEALLKWRLLKGGLGLVHGPWVKLTTLYIRIKTYKPIVLRFYVRGDINLLRGLGWDLIYVVFSR